MGRRGRASEPPGEERSLSSTAAQHSPREHVVAPLGVLHLTRRVNLYTCAGQLQLAQIYVFGPVPFPPHLAFSFLARPSELNEAGARGKVCIDDTDDPQHSGFLLLFVVVLCASVTGTTERRQRCGLVLHRPAHRVLGLLHRARLVGLFDTRLVATGSVPLLRHTRDHVIHTQQQDR